MKLARDILVYTSIYLYEASDPIHHSLYYNILVPVQTK
jgi:hypothetical protein